MLGILDQYCINHVLGDIIDNEVIQKNELIQHKQDFKHTDEFLAGKPVFVKKEFIEERELLEDKEVNDDTQVFENKEGIHIWSQEDDNLLCDKLTHNVRRSQHLILNLNSSSLPGTWVSSR